MFPRAFDYTAPTTLDEALASLQAVPGSKILAGGMSLIPMMKLRVLSPATVVDIGRIEGMGRIVEQDGWFEAGALVRHHQVAASRALAEHAQALAEAAGWTGDVQVRNRGTLCGSLAHADSAADQPAAVLALGGSMIAQSPRGVRTIPAADFFLDAFTTSLAEDEVLTAVRIPRRGTGEGSAYRKLGRRGRQDGFAIAAVAAWVKLDGGAVAEARVALTGLSNRPLLAAASAEALIGTDGSPAAIRAAAQLAAQDVTLIADLYGSEEYKAHLAGVLAERALIAAVERSASR